MHYHEDSQAYNAGYICLLLPERDIHLHEVFEHLVLP